MRKKLAGCILGTVMAVTAVCSIYSYAQGSGETKLSIASDEEGFEEEESQGGQLVQDSTLSYEGSQRMIQGSQMVSGSQPFSYGNVADVAEAVMPAIVSITNKSVQEVRDWFSRRSFQYESESAGSGFIIGSNDEELLIVTNNHVVEGADTLTVTFIDENSYEAQVKGTSPEDDLAVVAVKLDDISDDTMDEIRIAQMGDSEGIRVGEQVVAIGNALGYGQSVTTGIISAKNRSIQVQDGRSVLTYENLLQTDAAINPGNSGGALLNMNGEVIGINSAKASSGGVEGMGYAIPVDKALPILEELMTLKTRTLLDEEERGYIGISGEGVSSEATYLYGIPQGVYIVSISDGTPAQKAGLQVSDIITKFDGYRVTSMDTLRELLQYYEAGEEVELTIMSAADGAYTEKTVTVTLASRAQLQY